MDQYPQRRFWMLGPMVVVALVVGVLLGKGWERTGHATETYEELKTFSEVLTQVQKSYVDETKVKDLVQGAIRGMLSTLDPHSAYMTPDMYKEMQVETKGEFGGVGFSDADRFCRQHRVQRRAPDTGGGGVIGAG